MLPGILTQLGTEGLSQLKRLANNVGIGNKILSSVEEGKEEEDIPDLVENFENVANSDSTAKPEASPALKEEEKKVEEIAAQIASSTLQEAATAEKTAATAKPEKADDKKESKKETTPKKSNENKGGKKQQSKDKKA